jgi:hypothetical protein
MAKKSKRGRPPRHKGEVLAKNRTFRVRGELDEQLQGSAAKAGRSVSEEIEYRLSRSYFDDLRAAEFVGDDASADAIRMIRLVMAIESISGPWSSDPASAQRVSAASDTIIRTFARLRPEPSKGTAAQWGAAIGSYLVLFRSTAWKSAHPEWTSALPPELLSYAKFAEEMLVRHDAEQKASETPKK